MALAGSVVTIRDVATAAGVSVATVSRALNNRNNVASQVRMHVLSIARELNYVPHAGASSLSSRRTNMVGLVLPDLHGEFFSELIRGIDGVLRANHLHLLVSSYHDSFEDQREVLRNIHSRVDGVLLMSPHDVTPDAYRELTAISKPFVAINVAGEIPGAMQIGLDNYSGAVDMMEHLVGQGYRKIAFVTGPELNVDARERLRGYRESMARLLPDSNAQVFQGDFGEDSGYAIGQQLVTQWKGSQSVDAVFCANDMMAVGVQSALKEADIRVPEEVAIAGFDDIPLAKFMYGGLTSMQTDIHQIGRRAGEIIAHVIQGGERLIPNELIKPTLVVRDSTARRR